MSIDSVYFFMWPTWSSEAVGNRWHFARRWARLAPVVLVQPDEHRHRRHARVGPEPRIANCEILHVAAAGGRTQALQIERHLRAAGRQRPLLWAYNPELLAAYALTPAAARVFHASENYFGQGWFHGVGGEAFERRLRAAYEISDRIVAVSEGLADVIRDETGIEALVETNGCDFGVYSNGTPDPELAGRAASYTRTAVYAGNLSVKVDFGLLLRCATEHPDVLFALFGPVADLVGDAASAWSELRQRPNVWYGGTVSVERLADLYAASDVGLIPYLRVPLLVDVGFPLKLFEMGAAGLPVVSTELRSLEQLGGAVHVARSEDDFVERVGAVSRATEPAETIADLVSLARANDYDAKFERIAAVVEDVAHAAVSRDAEAAGAVGQPGWSDHLASPPLSVRTLQAARAAVPASLRRLAPRRTRRLSRKRAA